MTAEQRGERVAVLGLGRMGAPLAARLVDAGFAVTGFDPRSGSDRKFEVAGSAAVAADSARYVLTVLPGTPELRDLMLSQGLLDDLAPGTIWIDCTSTSPDVGAELLAAAARRGVERLDCGLGGDPDSVRAGTVHLYVGGDDDVVERCRPVLGAITTPDRIHHLGGPGSGTLAKLLVNLIWFGQATLIAEALLLARSSGVDARALAEVLPATAAASAFATDFLPRVLAGDYVPSFGIDRVVEELDGLERLAEQRRSPFGTGTAVARIHRDAYNRYGPAAGELLAVKHLEERAGGPLG